MNEILDMLDRMKEMQLVRFFSRFFTEERLSPLLGRYKDKVAGDAGGLAGEFLAWAVALAVGALLIDQIFYWTAPGRIDQARENWHEFLFRTRIVWGKLTDFFRRVGDGLGRALPRGRR